MGSPSQVEANDFILKLLADWQIKNVSTPQKLLTLRNKMFSILTVKPYNDETKDAEKQIRWKRTGAQVLEDGYVYQGKACTDLVIAFIALARAAGVENTNFVKLKNNNTGMVHSVGEFKLEDGWYIFDIANKNSTPVKGEIKSNVPWGGPPNGPFLLWKKGGDSWALELTDFDSIGKIKV